MIKSLRLLFVVLALLVFSPVVANLGADAPVMEVAADSCLDVMNDELDGASADLQTCLSYSTNWYTYGMCQIGYQARVQVAGATYGYCLAMNQ